MNRINLSIILFLLIGFSISKGQEIKMEEKPNEGAAPKFGPNQKYFIQFTMGAGALLGSSSAGNLTINDLRSDDFFAGFKFKRKVNGFLSVWLQPEFHYAAYNIDQTGNNFTDSIFQGGNHKKHEVERFSTEAIALNGFLRFNFDYNRGNFLGYYFDLGARGDLNLGREYLTTDKTSNGEATTNYTGVPYLNSTAYNVFAKIGVNWIAVTFNYRMSRLFKSEYNLPEPPIYTVGLEINPYSH